MGDEKILTLHPEGKQGVNIDLAKYEMMKQAIIEVIAVEDGITFTDLHTAVSAQLDGKFEGSIGWYLTSVKLDLEARNIIERIPGSGPQRLRLCR